MEEDSDLFDFFTEKNDTQYDNLVKRIIVANPGLTEHATREKIKALEEKYGRKFYGVIYSDEPNKKLVFERKRLSQLEELNLLTEEEKLELERLRNGFVHAVAEVSKATGEDIDKIQEKIDNLLTSGIAEGLFEAKEIMIGGPIITGFGETEDPCIPNSIVSEFLRDTFTLAGLRKARVGKITKTDEYFIFGTSNDESYVKRTNTLTERGLVRRGYGGMLIAEDWESYIQAEMFLENTDDPKMVQHTFKLRAGTAYNSGFNRINLGVAVVESSKDFDYLTTIAVDSEEDKKRAYILGSIAHEMAHLYEPQAEKKIFEEYQQIIDEETAPEKRKRFVSDYVMRHSEIYKSDESGILKEDFAESVRIYTTNPDYLMSSYPRRFAFIKKNFSFIKPGSVMETIKKIKM